MPATRDLVLYGLYLLLFRSISSNSVELSVGVSPRDSPTGIIDECVFQTSFYSKLPGGVQRMLTLNGDLMVAHNVTVCKAFKNLDSAIQVLNTTKKFMDGLTVQERLMCRQDIACQKVDAEFLSNLRGGCNQGGIKSEERTAQFTVQWEMNFAKNMFTHIMRYIPVGRIKEIAEDLVSCAVLHGRMDTSEIQGELNRAVELTRAVRQKTIIPFDWSELVRAYNEGSGYDYLNFNFFTNISVSQFHRVPYINNGLDKIELIQPPADPSDLYMPEGKDFYTYLLLTNKYHLDAVFLYGETVMHHNSSVDTATQLAIVNGANFLRPQRCTKLSTLSFRVFPKVDNFSSMGEYRTWVSKIAKEWILSKSNTCRLESWIEEVAPEDYDPATSFYKKLGYDDAAAVEIQAHVRRWFIVMQLSRTFIGIAKLIYTKTLEIFLLAIMLTMMIGIGFLYEQRQKRINHEVRDFMMSKPVKKTKKKKDKKKGYMKVNGKKVNLRVTRLWMDTISEHSAASFLSFTQRSMARFTSAARASARESMAHVSTISRKVSRFVIPDSNRHASTPAGAPVNAAASNLSVGYKKNSRLKVTTSRTQVERPPSVTDVASKLTLKYKNNSRIRVATSRTKLEKSSSTNLLHHRSTISEVEEVEEGLATFTEEA